MSKMVDLTNDDTPLLLSNGMVIHGSINLDAKNLSPYKKYFLETTNASSDILPSSDQQSVFINQAQDKHNEYRLKYGVPNLKHNPELSRIALKWAQDLASRKVIKSKKHTQLSSATFAI